jgi:hypothetical protein
MGGCVGVAEDCFLAASQHRAHPPPLTGQDGVANQIDLREVTDEPTHTESVGDLLVAETERPELPMTNGPVLGARKRGDLMIQVVSW